MLPLNHINSALTREERIRLNQNWDIIRDGINNIQSQMNLVFGGEADKIIAAINKALEDVDTNSKELLLLIAEINQKITESIQSTTNANEATVQANTASVNAVVATNAANTAVDNASTATAQANTARDNANTATNAANTAISTANSRIQEMTNAINDFTLVLTEAETRLADFNNNSTTAITNVTNATEKAEEVVDELEGYTYPSVSFSLATSFVKHRAARFNGSTYRAKQDTLGNPLPVSPAVENDWWVLEAQRGTDGTGAVSSVNNIPPDEDGNVDLGNLATNWESIDDKPSAFPPSEHRHDISEIDNLPDTMPPSPHRHIIDDVDGLRDALNNAGAATLERKIQHFVATEGQTVFELEHPYTTNSNFIEVVVGGIPQFSPDNFEETSSTLFTLLEGASLGTKVTAIYYTGFGGVSSIPNASISEKGLAQLETSITSDSETTAATPKSVKQIADLLKDVAPTDLNLTSGMNDIYVSTKTPVNVKRIDGQTIVNHVPLFDSGAWVSVLGELKIVESNEANIISTGVAYAHVKLNSLKPDTTYTLSSEHNGTLAIRMNDSALVPDTPDTVITFTTPSSVAKTELFISANSQVGTFIFKNISLIEGSEPKPFVANIKGLTNPTIVNEANGTSLVIPTTLYDGEYIERNIKGELVKYGRFQEKELDGSENYFFALASGDRKSVMIRYLSDTIFAQDTIRGIKYDGKVLPYVVGSNIGTDTLRWSNEGELSIEISNSDSGWGASYTPTQAEIKAYFLGWKMYGVDGPDGVYIGTGPKYFAYRTDESGKWHGSDLGEAVVPHGQAPINSKWQPYRVVYELATHTNKVVNAYGDLILERGDNRINIYAGRIVNEHVTPHVSDAGWASINNTAVSKSNLTRKKSLKILNVLVESLSSDIIDWHEIYDNSNGIYRIGKWFHDDEIELSYTVDYEPLYVWDVTTPIDSVQLQHFNTIQSVVDELTVGSARQQDTINRLSKNVVNQGDGIKWITPTLLNGFLFVGGHANGYFKDSLGNVTINLIVELNVITSYSTIFRLPKGYIPTRTIVSPSSHYSPVDKTGFVLIYDSGVVALGNASGVGSQYHVISVQFKAEQ